MNAVRQFESTAAMLKRSLPVKPVYCVYRDTYLASTRSFVSRFPGRVLFAVKANDDPSVLKLLHSGGVNHFDCASVPEIEAVKAVCPDAKCYFMVPVRLRGAASEAREQFGVRHFVVDCQRGLELLAAEIDLTDCVVFARMAVHHRSALQDLSSKFGGDPKIIPDLLDSIRQLGAEPALAFNVGSSVTDPQAYGHAISVAADVLNQIPFKVRLVDIGGGFPRSYPGFSVPPLSEYFEMIEQARVQLPLADGGEILGEPGRALAAPGLSAVVEVLLRKDNRLYINDGMYGIFWELRFDGHDRYPVRVYRRGQLLEGAEQTFSLYGPTCDATDVLPGTVSLPEQITEGDHLEFGRLGAYSLSGRTRFNGLYSDDIVWITGAGENPPAEEGQDNADPPNQEDSK